MKIMTCIYPSILRRCDNPQSVFIRNSRQGDIALISHDIRAERKLAVVDFFYNVGQEFGLKSKKCTEYFLKIRRGMAEIICMMMTFF